ncbi:hypothetical protein OsJ_36111 [Oryza sativa Japonica Group]|uniref:CCHC-type domain-containing protein n=1 Tax=Oryza sativa subsp. japonica TaxID=39947 RepID=B9GD60_ORYSJ|nr:hypothetical protein OsJ_36111 [Oryza sativa Japonica Group]
MAQILFSSLKTFWQCATTSEHPLHHVPKLVTNIVKKIHFSFIRNLEQQGEVNKGKAKVEVKGSGKPYCYRCYTKGHTMQECSSRFYYEICESEDHVASRCPIFRSSVKPVAQLCGYAGDGLGFFHIPLSAGMRVKHEPKAAMVKVTKGQMSVSSIISELERFIPGRWKWVVHDNGDGTFRSSAAELSRMVEWGKVHTKVGEAEMEIVERGVGNEVKYVMPKVITKAVDMIFTRRYDIARLQVLVLDPSLIPDVVDMVIGDHLYELFRVEPENGPKEPVPMEMENLDDGDLEKKKEGNVNQDLGKGAGLFDSGNSSKMGSGGQFSERGCPSAPSSQLNLIPESDGLTVSDEEFDGLDEETIMVDKAQIQESLVAKLSVIPEAVISPSRKSKRRESDSD